jgi:hypothetical protein
VFDFGTVPCFARDYLSTYYCQPPAVDEQVVLSFLVRHYPLVTSSPCAIEVGCGPTVHHVLPLAPFVSEIHMADYLPDNLEQVRAWRDHEPGAHRWQEYTAFTLAREGRLSDPAAVAHRETETRRKISQLLPCDLTSDRPLPVTREYPVVASFYCAENIGVTTGQWRNVMRRLAGLIAPGGMLFLSALRETDFYVVRSGDGTLRRLPAACLTASDFEQLLPALGFRGDRTVIESVDLQGLESEGLRGVILVAAQKQ